MMRSVFLATAVLASSVVPLYARPVADTDSVASSRWAVPHVSAVHVRTEPRHGSEMSTQALMGWPVKVLDRIDGWSYVELPDGYQGYIIDNSLTFMAPDSVLARWRNDPARVVAVNLLPVMACDSTGAPVADIVQGDILLDLGSVGMHTIVQLPDGRCAQLPSSDCIPIDVWQRREPDAARILAVARGLMGVPYLWGGVTAKGMDCSGLTRMAYLSEGIMLPRDASQQALAGRSIPLSAIPDSTVSANCAVTGTSWTDEKLRDTDNSFSKAKENIAPADLLFFASATTGRINHVALYAGDGMMLESAGRVMLSPVPWSRVVAIRRILP